MFENYPTYINKDFSGNVKFEFIFPYVPDAGCIPGCKYTNRAYRPAFDFEDSMMNSYHLIGPGEKGLGSWNKVSYAVCKEKVDSYS